jgi:hypothetical protein
MSFRTVKWVVVIGCAEAASGGVSNMPPWIAGSAAIQVDHSLNPSVKATAPEANLNSPSTEPASEPRDGRDRDASTTSPLRLTFTALLCFGLYRLVRRTTRNRTF